MPSPLKGKKSELTVTFTAKLPNFHERVYPQLGPLAFRIFFINFMKLLIATWTATCSTSINCVECAASKCCSCWKVAWQKKCHGQRSRCSCIFHQTTPFLCGDDDDDDEKGHGQISRCSSCIFYQTSFLYGDDDDECHGHRCSLSM